MKGTQPNNGGKQQPEPPSKTLDDRLKDNIVVVCASVLFFGATTGWAGYDALRVGNNEIVPQGRVSTLEKQADALNAELTVAKSERDTNASELARIRAKQITVKSARYGASPSFCQPEGQVLKYLSDSCNGLTQCSITVANEMCNADPSPGQTKTATVVYACGAQFRGEIIRKEGDRIEMSCPQ